MDTVSDDPSLLVLVIDVNRVWWGEKVQQAALSYGDDHVHSEQRNGYKDTATNGAHPHSNNDQISLTEFIDSVVTFCNAHLLTNHRNRLAIIASLANRSQYIYPPRVSTSSSHDTSVGATADTLQMLKNSVKGELSLLLSEIDDRELLSESVTAGAMSMALCYINKEEHKLHIGEKINSRILIVKGLEDNSEQYMNFMNAVFTAQKKNILIDACLFQHDSGLLQQACDITGGIYMRLPQMKGLLQYLLWTFLPDQVARSKMSMPPRSQVDYRAACFCHRQLIDRGYVCSVCLSIFCSFQAICSTCRVPFKIPGGPLLKKKRKLLS